MNGTEEENSAAPAPVGIRPARLPRPLFYSGGGKPVTEVSIYKFNPRCVPPVSSLYG